MFSTSSRPISHIRGRVSVQPHRRIAVADANAPLSEIRTAAAAHGLRFPHAHRHDTRTIGATVTAAWRPSFLRHGSVLDHVVDIAYSGADVSQVTVNLLPEPSSVTCVVATFGTRRAAAEAALDIVAWARPTTLDLLDRGAIDAVNRYADEDLGWSGAAVLVATIESDAATREIATVERVCRSYGAREVRACSDPAAAEAVATVVHSARTALEASGSGLDDDVTTAASALPNLLDAIDRLERRIDVRFGVLAQPGDGLVTAFVVRADTAADACAARIAFSALSMRISSPA